jgi:hypothetical protein
MNSFSSAPLSFPLDSIAFFGRSFDEYRRFFHFVPSDFRGRTVLDVAAGPSSFTAEARPFGVNAVAVDPLYGCTPAALAIHVHLDYRAMHARMRAQPGCFRFRSFTSFEAAERDRTDAAQRFLADYEAHFAHDRYVGAALPSLPFADASFDLVLCAHLLFIYAARFDYPFHLAAFKELARVARHEVRVHPVCGTDGKTYGELNRLRRDLAAAGVESEVRPVDYEFFAGTATTLFLAPRFAGRPQAPEPRVDARVCAAPA